VYKENKQTLLSDTNHKQVNFLFKDFFVRFFYFTMLHSIFSKEWIVMLVHETTKRNNHIKSITNTLFAPLHQI